MSRGFPTKDFSGTLVEHFLISAELLIRYERQIRAFGQVVADATVLAFAGAALPRAVRVAEEDLQVEIGGEELVLGHLLALVVGEGFEQSRWDVIQFTREGRAHSGGVFFREMAEEGEARGALNQHADGGLVPRTEDQVTLVVAGNQASFHFRWTLIDQHHVLQFALSGGDTPPAGLAPTVVTAQTGRQLPLQFAPGDDVNVAVNRFVGGVHQGQITVITFEAASDLLWRPATMQALVNFGPQRRVLVDGAVTPSRRPTPALRRTMRLGGTVTPRPAVKRQLPTDRSGRTGQPNCDDRLGVTGAQRRFQLDTFFQVQMGIGHRSPLRARRGGGKLRNGRMTAKPVLRPFLSFGRRLAKANTTRRNSVIIHGALVQMRSSNSSLSAPLLLSSGCQTLPPVDFGVGAVGVSRNKIDAELKNTSVQIAPKNNQKGEIDIQMLESAGTQASSGQGIVAAWQNSLQDALARMAIFNDLSNRKLSLSVVVLKLDIPSMGISFETETIAKYELIDRATGDIVYTSNVVSKGSVAASEAFLGVIRARVAASNSVRENIKQFLRELETVDLSKPMFPAKATK